MKSNKFLSIRSRHPSCRGLRKKIPIPFKTVYRHGSTTKSTMPREINSIDAVECSASKLRMKQAFDKAGVRHPRWSKLTDAKCNGKYLSFGAQEVNFPVVIKSNFGSRGRGNYKIDTSEEYDKFVKSKDLSNYIVEQFFSGSREYRVHITNHGAIYSLRKVLKLETPKEKRWVRNDETCSWICERKPSLGSKGEFLGFTAEESPVFDKPVNWDKIVEECKKALNAVGLDVGACDVRVQSALDKEGRKRAYPEFTVIEINSAPAMGRITTEIYKKELPVIARNKYDRNTKK